MQYNLLPHLAVKTVRDKTILTLLHARILSFTCKSGPFADGREGGFVRPLRPPPSGYGPVHSAGLDCRGCKAVSYGRNILMNANYNLKQSILAREDSYNDLGVKFDTKLKFDCHINEKVNKAYGILSIIKRYFYYYVKRLCMVTPPSGID